VAGYSGDAGDALATAQNPVMIANGMEFSTPDRDNDASPGHHAGDFGRGWWDGWYTNTCLNQRVAGRWMTETPVINDVQASRMLVKLN